MPKNIDSIMNTFEVYLGDQPFVAVDDLLKMGILGSYGALYYLIKKGEIPVIKISNRRLIARREDLIKFFRKKLHEE